LNVYLERKQTLLRHLLINSWKFPALPDISEKPAWFAKRAFYVQEMVACEKMAK
jgi:hypothetical protein